VESIPDAGTLAAPMLLSPAKGEKLVRTDVVLDWAGPDAASTFSIVVRLGGPTGVIVFSEDHIQETQFTATDLPRGRYAWQVTACDGSRCTTSPWRKFKVKAGI
jgi:hypothetical protein